MSIKTNKHKRAKNKGHYNTLKKEKKIETLILKADSNIYTRAPKSPRKFIGNYPTKEKTTYTPYSFILILILQKFIHDICHFL